MNPAPLRIVTYSRVSTSHHEQNPDAQVHELRRYCEAREWHIAHEIIDHGYSGGTNNRPGLKKLMAMARGRQIDAVVVVKLDRLFRSLKHLVTTLDEFQALGIIFVATADQLDYTSPAGRLLVQVLGSLAEFEKSLLRERTMMGLEHAKRCGKKLGRPRTRDDEAITKLRESGLSYKAISQALQISDGAVYRAIKGTSKSSQKTVEKS